MLLKRKLNGDLITHKRKQKRVTDAPQKKTKRVTDGLLKKTKKGANGPIKEINYYTKTR
jgi:hypothetical protein